MKRGLLFWAAFAAAAAAGCQRKPGVSPAASAGDEANWGKVPGLYAVLETSRGTIVCRLFEREAPKTTANFAGLASGTIEYVDPRDGQRKTGPYYNGVPFHRVIPDFMIQTGDPTGTGRGGPGYQFADELAPGLSFDKPGRLAMANSGPNTNGSQFFITTAPATHLNGLHSIFGEVVVGQSVADDISRVTRDAGDRPLVPVTLTSVAIKRVP